MTNGLKPVSLMAWDAVKQRQRHPSRWAYIYQQLKLIADRMAPKSTSDRYDMIYHLKSSKATSMLSMFFVVQY